MDNILMEEALHARRRSSLPHSNLRSQQRKRSELGIECVEYLQWKDWQPGKKYVKTLMIMNTTKRVQTLRWQPPQSPYFCMEFHDPVRLNPGATVSIGILFRPENLEKHESFVEFSTSKGTFTVSLKGNPPKMQVEMPEYLDFGCCAVKDISECKFQLCNTGEIDAVFQWIVQPPFSFLPPTGTLLTGKTTDIVCRFEPSKASAFKSTALVSLAGSKTQQMELSGVGKYAFLLLSNSSLEFGDVLVGSSRELELVISNTSEVIAKITLRRTEGNKDPDDAVFFVNASEAMIHPKASVTIKVLYSPFSAGASYMEEFEIISCQRVLASFTCSGFTCRPLVKISCLSLDFGSLEPGKSSSHSISLKNYSIVHVSYQFITEELGVFHFHKSKGVIRPRSTITQLIEFRPTVPANYYKRVFCILQDQYPLFCDLIGSCYSGRLNFPTLLACHVYEFRKELQTGSLKVQSDRRITTEFADTRISPLSSKQDTCRQLCSAGMDTMPSRSSTKSEKHVVEIMQKCEQKQLIYSLKPLDPKIELMGSETWEEYFLGRVVNWEPVTLDVTFVDFGLVPRCEEHMCSAVERAAGAAASNKSIKGPTIFDILPKKAEIPAGKTRFSEGPSLMPPWSTSVQVLGHSFTSNSRDFLPQASFFPSRVVFPPTLPGTSVYQTIAFRNHGHTPLRFSFNSDNLDPGISVKPSKGIVEAKSFALVSFKFRSAAPGFCTQKISCALNNSDTEEIEIALIGSSQIPEVKSVDGSLLQFKPAAVGTSVTQVFTLQNPAGTAAWFEWQIPSAYQNIFIIKPTCGLIVGKERLEFRCTFCPEQLKKYQVQVPCHTLDCIEEAIYYDHAALSQTIACDARERFLLLTLEGEGLKGTITIEPEELNLGTVSVGSSYERKVTLCNSSDAYLEYVLAYHPTNFIQADAFCLNLDCPNGIIPARSSKEVMISFEPKYASAFHFEIACKINLLPEQERSRQIGVYKGDKFSASCVFTSNALFPSLLISGVRCEGFSAHRIWNQLQLGLLNHVLSKAQYNIHKDNTPKNLFGLGTPLEFQSPIVWNFGKRNIGTRCTSVDVVLRSLADSTVKWRIRFWNDKEVDMENWVEDSEPVDDECHYMFVKEMNLFDVEPKQGCVSPGEEMHVNFRYRHDVEGNHSLPAILQIERGCSIPLWLCGRTFSSETKILTMSTKLFKLKPVAIGDLSPPLQTFELMNDGQSELLYEIDILPLQDITKENYGFEVLRCLNPLGSIPPFESVLLTWLFQPLEEKTYSVDIPVMVKEGRGTVLTVTGLGIHPRSNKSIEEFQVDRPPQGRPQKWLQVPATVSASFLDYGSMVELSTNDKLVAIQNLLEDSPIEFSWSTSFAAEKLLPGCFAITPSRGIIDPGKSSLCKVSFTAGTKSLIFATSINCYIIHVEERGTSSDYDRNYRLHMQQEETIAKDWKRLGQASPKKKANRKSVTSSLTEATRSKLPLLKRCDDVFGATNERFISPNSWTLCLSVAGSIQAIHKSPHGGHEFLSEFFSPGEPSSNVQSTEDTVLVPIIEDILQETAQDATRYELDDGKTLYFEQFQRSSALVAPKASALEPSSTAEVTKQETTQPSKVSSNFPQMSCEKIIKEKENDIAIGRFPQLKGEDKQIDIPTSSEFSRKASLADAPQQVKTILENLLFDTMKEFHDSAALLLPMTYVNGHPA
eukprot:Gb_05147 [translate_table: standard]